MLMGTTSKLGRVHGSHHTQALSSFPFQALSLPLVASLPSFLPLSSSVFSIESVALSLAGPCHGVTGPSHCLHGMLCSAL